MGKHAFHDYVVHDLMGHIRGIESKAMFGGWGLYKNGVVFGIIADDQLYFKAGDRNRKDYEDSGSSPFTYVAAGRKKVTMSYWEVPANVIENRDELEQWIDQSCKVSLQSKKRKVSRRRNS